MSTLQDDRMNSCNSTRGDYINNVYRYLKSLQPYTKVKISEISKNPEAFTEAVKFIIDLRMVSIEFSNDYKYITKKEEVNYGRNSKHLCDSGNEKRS